MYPPPSTKSISHHSQSIVLLKQFGGIILSSTAAILTNVALYYILRDLLGIGFLAPEQFPPPDLSPIPVTDVIIFSAIFSVGAGFVFVIVAHTARRPTLVFTVISAIALVASLYLPLRIPTPPIPVSTKLALMSMHILGAAVLVPLLIKLGLPARS